MTIHREETVNLCILNLPVDMITFKLFPSSLFLLKVNDIYYIIFKDILKTP